MSPADQPASPMRALAPGFCMIPLSPPMEILCVLAGTDGVTVVSSTINAASSASSAGIEQAPSSLAIVPGWQGLLVLDRVALRVVQGGGRWYHADSAALAKLLAFMDASCLPDTAPASGCGESAAGTADSGPGLTLLEASAVWRQLPLVVPEAAFAGFERRALERWFMTQSATPLHGFDKLSAVLRRTEWYRLVRFLLTQPATLTMQQLSKRYGLSYSYFRLLCRQALGRGGKAEFQHWRNVRALLDLADVADTDGSDKLTDVALRQGFASSSHFSDAMKGQFGVSPRELTRMLKQK